MSSKLLNEQDWPEDQYNYNYNYSIYEEIHDLLPSKNPQPKTWRADYAKEGHRYNTISMVYSI